MKHAKKLMALMLVLLLTLVAVMLTGCTVSDETTSALASEAMAGVLEIVASLAITLIGVGGAWLTSKLGKRAELEAINTAQQEVIKMAQQTVAELQQTMVENLKAASADGKLTGEEIQALGAALIKKTEEKMCEPTTQLLRAASVNIQALIQGAGEAWIAKLKENN